MKPVIIDNFLDKLSFQYLQKAMFGDDFNWFYNDDIDFEDDVDKFQFTHMFYKENVGVNSNQYEILNSILNKIQPKEIYRIKSNLLTKTPEIVVNTFHMDIHSSDLGKEITDFGIVPWTTSILYMNTNNGYTEFENGAIVESIENRMVVFPAEMKHRGTSCTDKKVRVVINFNYFT